MKAIMYFLAATVLSSFSTSPSDNDFDGIWMGYYRSDLVKEKMIVKFDNKQGIEFYTGGVDDRTRSEGTYRIEGDSVSFTYKTPEGEEITMQGHFNRRKSFVDGVWKTKDRNAGSFYLEKQKMQECFARP